LLTSPISRAFLLATVCFLAITPFFWWGSPSGHDFEFHLFSWMEVLDQWKQGIVYPRWAALAHWGYGEARFLFYPPASWTLGAALGALLPWKMVPGAYCCIALTLAAASMYRLARAYVPAADASFAAVFYALNPYHLLIVYWRSAYAELLAAALLPLLLLCLLKLNHEEYCKAESFREDVEPSLPKAELLRHEPATFREGHDFSRAISPPRTWALAPEGSCRPPSYQSVRPTLCLSLLLAAAWLTNAPAAVMIHYSIAGLAVISASIATVQKATRTRSWNTRVWLPPVRTLLWTALPMLLGAGLASFYLLPAIYEQQWINLSEVLSPGVRPQDNFLFTTIGDPDHNRFNLLVSTIALAEIGALALAIWFSKKKRNVATAAPGCPVAHSAIGSISDPNSDDPNSDPHPWMLLSAWGVASSVLMLSASNVLWQHLPKLRYVQIPFRWLLCMNVAVAMLLPMAARRWTTRLLTGGVLLSTLVLAGYRVQPPWWDKAADIREMSDAMADGTGYEGTDEYVPAGDDPYELDKNLPLVSDDTGAPMHNRILAWRQTEKHFTVRATAAQNITVRLFSYPAWDVVVNGKPTITQKTEITGLIVIPVAAGENDVDISFRRTIDRVVGNIVSLISVAVFVITWMRMRMKTIPKKLV
jgi:hypothetical protein